MHKKKKRKKRKKELINFFCDFKLKKVGRK